MAYPKIGAGLAKADWSIIASIIEEELMGEDDRLVEGCATILRIETRLDQCSNHRPDG